jgi:hypothetical protein
MSIPNTSALGKYPISASGHCDACACVSQLHKSCRRMASQQGLGVFVMVLATRPNQSDDLTPPV